MLSTAIGPLLRRARKHLGLSREALSTLVGVSARLVAEVERGERPNVSLETALQLLRAVGVSLRMEAPDGETVTLPESPDSPAERAARAARRRASWSGRIVSLDESDEEPAASATPQQRLGDVTVLSAQVHAVAVAATRTARGR